MFLTDPSSNEPPKIIPLAGAKNLNESETFINRGDSFRDVFPDPILLSSLWDKNGPDNLTPNQGSGDSASGFGEKLDWNADDINPGHFESPLYMGFELAASESETAVYDSADDALILGFSLNVTELETMIEMDPLMESMSLGFNLNVAEQTLAIAEALEAEAVDMGFQLSVSESSTAVTDSAQDSLNLSFSLTVSES